MKKDNNNAPEEKKESEYKDERIEEIPERYIPNHYDNIIDDTLTGRPDDILFPPYDPPVPNRAWTEMKNGVDIDMLSQEEKRDLYIGRDNII